MRITLFIDSLAPGGAQRQLCFLARLLKSRGVEVSVLVYYPHDFFRAILEKEIGVSVELIEWKSQWERFCKVRSYFKSEKPDLVVSLLHVPNMLAELSRWTLFTSFKLIASERNHDIAVPSIRVWTRLCAHGFANAIVANSRAQASFLNKHAFWLRKRVSVITNCVDLDYFGSAARIDSEEKSPVLRLIVIGRYVPQKNGLELTHGLSLYRERKGNLPDIEIDWYGDEPDPSLEVKARMVEAIERFGLRDAFRLNESRKDVRSLYAQSNALCLPSLHEGCANVICEAMASGLPILASCAGDNDYLVQDGANGLLMPDTNAEAIAGCLRRFATLSAAAHAEMGRLSRQRAETLLAPERFGAEWMHLVQATLGSLGEFDTQLSGARKD